MKSFFPFFLAAVTTVSASLAVPDDDSDCGSFSLKLEASYQGDVAVKCSEEDMKIMNDMVKAIAQIDGIASGVYKDTMPDFDLGFEKFSSNTTVDYLGTLHEEPDDATVDAQMTYADELEEMYFGLDEASNERRLKVMKEMEDAEKEDQPKRLRGLSDAIGDELVDVFAADPNTEELVAADHFELGFTLIDGGLSGNGPRGSDLEQNHRRLFSCPPMGSCNQNWCCTFCGRRNGRYCRRRRRELLRTITRDGDVSEEREELKYERAVKRMEARVSKDILKKFRLLARTKVVSCLGLYWQLKVEFSTNLLDEMSAIDYDV